MRSRLPQLSLFALLIAFLVLAGPAACNLVAGLDKLSFTDDAGALCTGAASCDDENACTDDTCAAEGSCAHAARPDGPSPLQFPGDCQSFTCEAGTPVTHFDPGDPEDDQNPCTADTCKDGSTKHAVEPDDTTCSLNAAKGLCQGGLCVVACGPGKPACDDQEPCTTDVCLEDTGQCSFTPLADGMPNPAVANVAGDCQAAVCTGGKPAIVNDDLDKPSFPGDCQEGQCLGGQPSAQLYPADLPCVNGGGKFCDGMGACVACNQDLQCGVTDECQSNTCAGHACTQQLTPPQTPVLAQVPGDCHVDVCNGSGQIESAVDDGDPGGDGNPCTDDLCTNGALTHPDTLVSTVCGNSLVCDGAGACVGCVNNGQCMAPATCGGCGMDNVCCCQPKTCTSLGLHCGAAPDGCGGMLMCNDGKSNGETDVDCGGPSCAVKCGSGKVCSASADCVSGNCADGVCCASACSAQCKACNLAGSVGTCTNLPSGQVDNAASMVCNGASVCDGGGLCKKSIGQACAANSDCLSLFCADGVCCNNSCSTTCQACNLAGSVGMCSPITAGTDNSPVNSCVAPSSCDPTGNCKKGNGQACAVGADCVSGACADNVCCDQPCSGSCRSCTAALKGAGMDGACGFTMAGIDPNGDCAPLVCNGVGGCQ